MSTSNRVYFINTLISFLLCPYILFSQGGIFITSGSNLVNNGSSQLVINNAGFRNDGAFVKASGTVVYTGNSSTPNSNISGTVITDFYNLTLNKTGNGIQLTNHISVSNVLSLVSGDSVFLNQQVISLGNSGSISGENALRRITGLTGGYIEKIQVLNAPVAVNPGNIGVEITTAANMGSTIIRRGHVQQMPLFSIHRYFDIIPAFNLALNATLKFYYSDAELAGNTEAGLQLYSSSTAGLFWTLRGSEQRNSSSNFVLKENLNQLNRFTLGTPGVLGVNWISIDAYTSNAATKLYWKTSNEQKKGNYEIERSGNGVQFVPIDVVAGIVNYNSDYQYTDRVPLYGKNYYRIRWVDDEQYTSLSTIVNVQQDQESINQITVYPNPVADELRLSLTSEKEEDTFIEMEDVYGRSVLKQKIKLTKGANRLQLPVNHLNSGIYTIRFAGATLKTVRFVKQ